MDCNLNLGFNFPPPPRTDLQLGKFPLHRRDIIIAKGTQGHWQVTCELKASLEGWTGPSPTLKSLRHLLGTKTMGKDSLVIFVSSLEIKLILTNNKKNMQTGVRQFPGFSRGFPGSFFRPFWTLLHNGKLIGSNLQILQWFGVSYMFSLLVPQILCLEFGNLSADLRHQDMRTNWI